jgi:serine/threonine-protein kinase
LAIGQGIPRAVNVAEVQPLPASEPSGQTLGPYSILHEVGRGGMGTVHQARHLLLGTRVALKRMLPELARDARTVERFLREARVGARLRHPHIASVLDAGNADGTPWLAVEWIEGETMASLLAHGNPLPLASAVDLLLPIIDALATAHALGVVHRDVKPQNILLSRAPDGATHPVLIDFGVAKILGYDHPPAHAPTTTGSILGTVAYMAPEQIENAGSATEAVDQFAVGVVLYQCITGRMPFSGANAYEHMHATLHANPTPPSQLAVELPPEVDEVVLRAIARKPENRFPSVRALGGALLPFAGEQAARRWASERDQSSLSPFAHTQSERASRRPPPRQRAAKWAIGLGLFAAGLVVGGAASRPLFKEDSCVRTHSPRTRLVVTRGTADEVRFEHVDDAPSTPPATSQRSAVAAPASAAPASAAPTSAAPASAPSAAPAEYAGPRGTNGAPIVP